jgi:hypothetical protein
MVRSAIHSQSKIDHKSSLVTQIDPSISGNYLAGKLHFFFF